MLTDAEFKELFCTLTDCTPIEGEWRWPMADLISVPSLAKYAPVTRHDKVVAFRKRLREATEGDRITQTSARTYKWMFDRTGQEG